MPQYKLTYFNVKGVGEPIRYIFAYSGVQFEDDRIEIDDWADHKDDKPFGQVPVLDTGDSVLLTQSVAIARYLGKTFGLSAETDLKNAQLDGLVDHMQDLHNKLYAFIRQQREAESSCNLASKGKSLPSGPTPIETFESDVLQYFLKKFNTIASGGTFYGNTVTWVDVYFAGWLDVMETRLKKPLLEPYPHLKALKQKVESRASLQDYLKKRPFNNQ